MRNQNPIANVEYNLIGCFLVGGLSPDARNVMTWLEPEMFATSNLGSIYRNIRKHARKDNMIDMVVLNSDFGEDFAMMAEIANKTYSVANPTGYAQKVRNAWVNRAAQKSMLELAAKLQTARDEQVEGITEQALAEIQKLLVTKTEVKPVLMADLVDSYADVLEKRTAKDFSNRLLYTGIQAVDDILGGIDSTDIVVVAGRPGTGKTEFSLTVARNIAAKNGSVLFFSLEMGNTQLLDRILSAQGGVSVKKLRNPHELDELDYNRLATALGDIKKHEIYFVDRGGLSAEEIKAITENHINAVGAPSAIVIDYLGLMNHNETGNSNKAQAIGNSMSALKAFAKNFNIPIILLCQLNREADGKSGGRPINSQLRESGSIEQDASQIIMLYRESNHNQNSSNPYTEAIITKNRFGAQGTAYLEFRQGHFIDCDQAKANEFITSASAPAQTRTYKTYGKGAVQ
ncbi:replicative DNA helicase [Aggregatibacter actinomycetemcomitans]|uniref:replicative DNA helicase n=1 Tax=Aggregatibacter actinomycetemcomitans TaxID=714 RepID=UPI001E3A44BE|nr:replicative DNA helicase [Aggregatibacter actinomycetemcomitans]